MTHRILTRVSETDVVEISTALRLTAERYGKHSRDAAATGSAGEAEFWADAADRCARLCTQIMWSDDCYMSTRSNNEEPGNTFEINANETRDLPGEFKPPF